MDGERLSADRFQIISRLGEGAFGIVYEARDRTRGERVAVKALHRMGSDALLRFKQEFRSLCDIRHPNLVRLDELIEQRGRWYITMELVRGSDVLSYVRRGSFRRRTDQAALGGKPPYDGERLRSALAQLAHGLIALHDAGKIHRDIKPSNVRVTHDGRVVLLDFGVIADAHEDSSTAPSMVGTAAYMSPEQAATAPLTPASDWYSVGVLLYEALTGNRPFMGSPLQMMLDKQRRVPVPPGQLSPGVPDDLQTLCMDLLAIDPSVRPVGKTVLERLGARALMLPVVQRVSFVGRSEELRALVSGVEGLMHGEPSLFYVMGQSGSGKTRLLGELGQRVRADFPNVLVLRGRCHESESVPYKAFDGIIDGVSRHLRHVGEDDALRLVPEGSEALSEVFPVLSRIEAVTRGRARDASAEPWAQRTAVFDAIRELFVRLGRSLPVVLLIDDLHWADTESLQLLERLVTGPDRPRLLIVGSGRPLERCPSAVRHVIEASTSVLPSRVLALGPMASADGERFARELILQRVDQLGLPEELSAVEGLARAIVREAEGHPFLIDFIVKNARALGGELNPLPSLDEVLARSFGALHEDDLRVLELLALSAAPLKLRALALALGLTQAQLNESVARLSGGGFVVEDGAGDEIALSVVQERIQQAVLERLTDEQRVERHALIARGLLATGYEDAEALAMHLSASGDVETATHYALIAAGSAYDALAFERAARLYRLSLDLSEGDGDARRRRRLLARLGDSLAGAGKGAEAADAYLAAVDAAKDMDGADLSMRAAQQMIQAGRVSDGLSVIQQLLASRGHVYPASTSGAHASLLWARAKLRFRGLRFEERGATWIAPERLNEVDLLWSVSCALGMVDMMRSTDLQTRHLLHALEAGEPYRVARGLAIEGWFQQSTRAVSEPETQEIFSTARLLADRSGHPHAQAVVALAEGAAANSICRFQEAVQKCREAEQMFRERCRAAAWEIDTAQFLAGLALSFLGRFGELAQRAPGQLREARERGDRYAETLLLLSVGYWPELLFGDAAAAIREVERATEGFRAVGFTLQGFMKFVALSNIYLYDAPDKAYDVLVREHATLDGPSVSRVPMLRVLVNFALGQAALASAATLSPKSTLARARYQIARNYARKLGREDFAAAVSYASLIEGAVAAQTGDMAKTLSCLHEAAARFDSLQMGLYAAAARYREGALLGGERGRAQVAHALAWVNAQGIPNPEKLLAAASPGFRV